MSLNTNSYGFLSPLLLYPWLYRLLTDFLSPSVKSVHEKFTFESEALLPSRRETVNARVLRRRVQQLLLFSNNFRLVGVEINSKQQAETIVHQYYRQECEGTAPNTSLIDVWCYQNLEQECFLCNLCVPFLFVRQGFLCLRGWLALTSRPSCPGLLSAGFTGYCTAGGNSALIVMTFIWPVKFASLSL